MDLKTAIKELEKKYGKGTIMTLDEDKIIKIDTIPTGSISLDDCLGVGGIPIGRIIELYGPESSGKTTLALNVISEAQKQNKKCAFVDAEHSFDPEYAKNIGVDLKKLYISQPNSGEQALDIVEGLVKSGEISLIVVDSVAALTPQAEIDGTMGQVHVGLQARLMSQALRKLTAIAAQNKTAIIFVNQIRMNIGIKWGNPETTPGGNALKFYTSVRIEIRRAAKLLKKEEHIGNRAKIKIVKNKLAAPFKTTELDIIFNEGISLETDVVNYGLKNDVLKKEGVSIYFKDIKIGRGIETAREYLIKNKDVLENVIKEIKESKKLKDKVIEEKENDDEIKEKGKK